MTASVPRRPAVTKKEKRLGVARRRRGGGARDLLLWTAQLGRGHVVPALLRWRRLVGLPALQRRPRRPPSGRRPPGVLAEGLQRRRRGARRRTTAAGAPRRPSAADFGGGTRTTNFVASGAAGGGGTRTTIRRRRRRQRHSVTTIRRRRRHRGRIIESASGRCAPDVIMACNPKRCTAALAGTRAAVESLYRLGADRRGVRLPAVWIGCAMYRRPKR